MDMLISINDEPDVGRRSGNFDNPFMPKSANNPYYVMEIRETDADLLDQINELVPMIKDRFCEGQEYLFEKTNSGFKLKKKIDKQTDWDKWEEFTTNMYEVLSKALGIQADKA